jgi:transcriptional regulator with XRE-family HTH domain
MQHKDRAVPVFDMGDRLRKARDAAGLTQTELADALGIGRRSVSRYEDGHQTPKRWIVMAWAEVTGVPFEWLATGECPPFDGGQLAARRVLVPA